MAQNYEYYGVLSKTSVSAPEWTAFGSLEQYNHNKSQANERKQKRPAVIVASLLILFLASATGLPLSVILMIKSASIEKEAFLPRDLVFFASVLSLVYIGLHIRGARQDYSRDGMCPPQQLGHYLHAAALLVARLGIVIWLAALLATAVVIARSVPFHGFAGRVSVVNLMLCISTIPPLLIINITIERRNTPFTTAGISKASPRDLEDELAGDVSISRRGSLYQGNQQSKAGSVITMETEEIFKLGAPEVEEKVQVSAAKRPAVVSDAEHDSSAELPAVINQGEHVHPSPPSSELFLPVPLPAPLQTYYPGAWREEWDGMGPSRLSGSSLEAHASSTISSKASSLSFVSSAPRMTPSPPESVVARAPGSKLATTWYAAEPEIAIRQPIKVMRNPAYVPRLIKRPDSVAKRPGCDQLVRRPSKFARPLSISEKAGFTR
ncbi:hypothetical protein GGR50DRAFT_304798 [Xylaria sp. CBS 124048]|nr:hypothetical protein GGR50DRAFT_304798 [Xylaria sp. CBS 124048]